jgi:hypothetical protein
MFPLTIELNVRAVLLLAGLSVVVPLFAVVLYLVLPNLDFLVVHNVVLISFIGIFAVYRVSQRSRDVSIGLTTHSVSVNEGSGAVFPQMDAKLGQWAGQGTALHLRNADRRFVLGGRQYAVPTGARLDAKPVYSVDASMPAAAFHTLLNNIIYRQY